MKHFVLQLQCTLVDFNVLLPNQANIYDYENKKDVEGE